MTNVSLALMATTKWLAAGRAGVTKLEQRTPTRPATSQQGSASAERISVVVSAPNAWRVTSVDRLASRVLATRPG